MQCASITGDVFGLILKHSTDDELFNWYFGESSFKAFKGLISDEIISRNNRLTLTLKKLMKLENSFISNHQIEKQEVIRRQIDRLEPIQSLINVHSYVINNSSNFRNCSFLQNKDLRGTKFSNSALSLDLSYNKITSLHGIHFAENMTKLDVGYNQIKALNETFFPNSLTELHLSHNPIAGYLYNLPASLEILSIACCSNLTSLLVPRHLKKLLVHGRDTFSVNHVLTTCRYNTENGSLQFNFTWRRRTNYILT